LSTLCTIILIYAKQLLLPLPLVDKELGVGEDTQAFLLAAAKRDDVQSHIATQRELLKFGGGGHVPDVGLRMVARSLLSKSTDILRKM